MSKYTPTTEYVRDFYAKFTPSILIDRRPNGYERAEAEFDRWLAEHDREVAARTLRDAALDWQTRAWANTPRHADRIADRMAASQYACDWLRAHADQIEEGK